MQVDKEHEPFWVRSRRLEIKLLLIAAFLAFAVALAVFVQSHFARITGGDHPPSPGELSRTPHLNLSKDGPIQAGDVFDAIIFADDSEAKSGEESNRIRVVARPDLKIFPIKVWLAVSDQFYLTNYDIKTIVINANESRSTEVRFHVHAKPAFTNLIGSIAAYFDYDGQPCGGVTRRVFLSSKPPSNNFNNNTPPGPEGEPFTGLKVDFAASRPDLTVEVFSVPDDNTLQNFSITVSSPWLPEYESGIRTNWHTSDSTFRFVRQNIKEFTDEDSTRSADEKVAAALGVGTQFFEATPDIFQTAYWALVDSMKPFDSIAIVSDEPYLPWELMVPSRWLPDEERQWDDSLPLGAQYAIGRRLTRIPHSQTIALTNSLVIAPEYDPASPFPALANESNEVAIVSRLLGGMPIRPVDYDHLNSALLNSASVLHFVGHGEIVPDSGKQRLYLDYRNGKDTYIDSDQIRHMAGFKKFCASHPIIFLNACEIGRKRQPKRLLTLDGTGTAGVVLDML